MERWRQLQSDSQQKLDETGIPRQVLRRLLSRSGSGVGASILDAGCGRGELSAYLSRLGYRVTGFTESQQDAVAARHAAPQADIVYGVSSAFPTFPHKFHLVIVRELFSYKCSLFETAPLRATAMLISAVRPGGRLVFLAPDAGRQPDSRGGHCAACFAVHLECFPGSIEATESSAKSSGGWKSWFGWSSRNQPGIVEWEAPAERYSREEWLQFASDSRVGKRSICCEWAEAIGTQAVRRAAA